ncbi:50S ribosomal protein L29 [Candidatus Saccharibacteria bacterium QS_5_54_17]|nr:MAG: 50S ribosomal protein L29 [Candidatus Saccharibacteria bacterium QS_5_54_17]
MKTEELRQQSTEELTQQLAKDEADLADFTVDVRTKEVDDIRRGRRLRKEIARIKTIIREREL